MSRSVASVIVVVAGVLAAAAAPALQVALDPVSYVAGALGYLLTLTVLAIALWVGFRLTNAEFGWRWGRPGDLAIAIVYPLLVAIALVGAAVVSGELDVGASVDWALAARNVAIMAASTLLMALLTEEGFFRGALWGAAMRARWSGPAILLVTTLFFVAWHVAVPFVDREYDVPAEVMPVYFANATLLGLSWGLLRWGSGSLLAPCLAHAVWNGLAYGLFGSGDEAGALAIANYGLYDPERGLAGIAANLIVVVLLGLWVRARLSH